MIKKLISVFFALLITESAMSQILVGDMDGDNQLTTNDVELSASTVVGKTPIKYIDGYVIDNTPIVGTWWKSKTENITFAAYSTTTFAKGYNYLYLPAQKAIFLYNSLGKVVDVLNAKIIEGGDTLVLKYGEAGAAVKYVNGRPLVHYIFSITLSATSLEMETGGKQTLTATLTPENADEDYTWSSSNEQVAKVDQNGVVSAIGSGSATITVTTTKGITSTCELIVRTLIKSITFEKNKYMLKLGSTKTLSYTILPANSENSVLTWTSSDENIATVDENGVVTGISTGKVTIKATSSTGVSKTCDLIVTTLDYIPLEYIENTHHVDFNLDYVFKTSTRLEFKMAITECSSGGLIGEAFDYFNNDNLRLITDQGNQLYFDLGSNRIGGDVGSTNYYSTYVYEMGNYYLKRGGTTIGSSSAISFTRKKPLKLLYGGDRAKVYYVKIYEGDELVKSFVPVSSIENGEYILFEELEKKEYKTDYQDELKAGPWVVTKISLSDTSLDMAVGETHELTPEVTTLEGFPTSLIWSSSNESVATVQNGVVTARSSGKTTITCTDECSGCSVSCMVTVGIKTFTVNGVTFMMMPVAGGTFTMGATSEQYNGYEPRWTEMPTHQVTLSDYYIGETEVTQALWYAVMGAKPSSSYSWSSDYGLGDNYPAYYISWEECQTFIAKLNELTGVTFRMPTEAEWEYAARGGNKSNGYIFSGSNNINDVAWYKSNSRYQTHPIATKSPNELGIYDMTGNVWEWCSDWYGSYSSDEQTNPTGPSRGSWRMCRGGGCGNSTADCRVSTRCYVDPSRRSYDVGLRLVLSQF